MKEIENPKVIAKGFGGLVTKGDSTSLHSSSGIVPLTNCSNVDIDDLYRLSVRFGYESLLESILGNAHSVYGNKHINFLVFCEGDALSILDFSNSNVTRIRQVLINISMDYEFNSGLIYYTNGTQQGIINTTTLTNKPWEIETEYKGPVTTRIFSKPPLGKLLHYYRGRMYIANGPYVYISEPFDNTRFVLDEGNLVLDSDVFMMTSTDSCLILGLKDKVICYIGSGPEEAEKVTLIESPAINGTQQKAYPSDLGLEGKDVGIIFTTAKGIVFVTGDGTLIKLSEDVIDIPKLLNLQGCSIIKNGKYISQFNTNSN